VVAPPAAAVVGVVAAPAAAAVGWAGAAVGEVEAAGAQAARRTTPPRPIPNWSSLRRERADWFTIAYTSL
jgi:hypothetical protein